MTELLSKMTVTLLHAIKSSIQQGGLKDSLLTESEKELLEDMVKDDYFIKMQSGWWVFTRNYYHVTQKARDFLNNHNTKLHNLLGLIQKGVSEVDRKDKEAVKEKIREVLSDNDVLDKVFLLAYQVVFTDSYNSEEVGFCLKKDFDGWQNLQDEINEKGKKYFGSNEKKFIDSPFAEGDPIFFFEDMLFWFLVINDYINHHDIENLSEDFMNEGEESQTQIDESATEYEALVEQDTHRILTESYIEEPESNVEPLIDDSKNYGNSYESDSYDSGSSFDSGDCGSFD